MKITPHLKNQVAELYSASASIPNPAVKLINRDWTPDSEQNEAKEDGNNEKLVWEGRETNGEYENVGWMYVYAYEYIDVQNQLQEGGNWSEMYVRLPLICFESDLNEVPGFWRLSASSA